MAKCFENFVLDGRWTLAVEARKKCLHHSSASQPRKFERKNLVHAHERRRHVGVEIHQPAIKTLVCTCLLFRMVLFVIWRIRVSVQPCGPHPATHQIIHAQLHRRTKWRRVLLHPRRSQHTYGDTAASARGPISPGQNLRYVQ